MNERSKNMDTVVLYEGAHLPRAPRTFHRGMYGLTAFFTLLVILAASLPYPVTIATPITLQTLHPVVHLQAPRSAQVTHLFVSLGDTVKKGQYLAVLESNTQYTEIQQIREMLESSPAESAQWGTITEMGPDLQAPYAQFISAQGRWNEFAKQNRRSLEERDLYLQWQQSEAAIAQQRAQLENADSALDYHEKDVGRYRQLYRNGVISAQELEVREQAYLGAKQRALDARKELERSISQRERLSNARTLDGQTFDREERKLFEQWQLSKQGLQSALKKWEEQYLLTSPIAGTVSFAAVHSRNQWTSSGKRVFSITPLHSSEWFAECQVPLRRVGELQKGQKVHIHLKAYPFQQWGTLGAVTGTRAEIPYEGHYYMRALLESDTTDQGRKVSLAHDMQGTAYIQVSRSSLIGRIWNALGNAAKGHWDQEPKMDIHEK